MEVGTLIFLKSQEMLYRYIVYRPDKNIYLLEKPKEVSEYNLDQYINISAHEYINNAIIDKNEYLSFINEKIIKYSDTIEEYKKSKPDTHFLDWELKDLEKQISKIKEKENRTENQNRAIQQLEKAVRRVQKRKNGKIKKHKESQTGRIEYCQKKIRNLEKIIAYSRETE